MSHSVRAISGRATHTEWANQNVSSESTTMRASTSILQSLVLAMMACVGCSSSSVESNSGSDPGDSGQGGVGEQAVGTTKTAAVTKSGTLGTAFGAGGAQAVAGSTRMTFGAASGTSGSLASSGGTSGKVGSVSSSLPSGSGGTAASEPTSSSQSVVDCRKEGDGKTTLGFVNLCTAPLTYRGSDIAGGTLAPGAFACVDVGTASQTISSKRYWGWTGADPGSGRHTLAEFTFNTDFYDLDWYNISHVDAHNLPMAILPAARPNCRALNCPQDFLGPCPAEGQFRDAQGTLVSCVSPERDNPDHAVVKLFEQCDDAYAWSGDDQQGDDVSPMIGCEVEDFDIVFCPEAHGSVSSVGTETAARTDTEASELGAYPTESSMETLGGTMTFTNIGAPGWWPRRIDRPSGDPECTYKDGTDTWGGHCCMREQYTTSTTLAPFDQELTLILKAINVKQLAVYQPASASNGNWNRVSSWDARTRNSENLWFTQQGAGSSSFPGDLTQTDCVGYVMQAPRYDCGDGREYFCPDDQGVLHRGYVGSKLFVLLASMDFSDAQVKACGATGAGQPAPWVALVASELVRDGGRKWNGLCNCYSKTGTVGDGCGEMNVFEVVMDNNEYSNREFMSTGVRSYQVGHLGGAVAGANLQPSVFSTESEVLDACAKAAYAHGPVLVADGEIDGCPIWRRPMGDRFFMVLMDESTRTIQVGVIHPANVPPQAAELLPNLPSTLSRASVDGLVAMRLPT